MDGNNALRLFDAHEGQTLLLHQLKSHTDGGAGLGRGAGVLGVSLAGMDIAKIKQRAFVADGQVDAVAGGNVANIEVASPITLAVDTGGNLAIGSGADGADEWGNWPLDGFTEMEGAIACCAARARGMLENLGRVLAG